ncbi:MAG: cyclase [Planctomycetota bacterium]|nr:MAG: cyclase [Planctomycetota bacterium]
MSEAACATVKNQRQESGSCAKQANVGEAERWLSAIAGGTLIACSAGRTNARGLLGVLAGVALVYRGASGHCAVYEALGISTARRRGRATAVPARQGAKIEHTIRIDAPAEQLYRHWRVLENLPDFAPHLESVRESDPMRSHWVACAPLGGVVEWDAEIIEDRPGELISWRSLPGADLDSAGSVRFQSLADDETLLTLTLKYNPPGGTLTAQAAEFLGMGMQPAVEEALERFKRDVEQKYTESFASPRQTNAPR